MDLFTPPLDTQNMHTLGILAIAQVGDAAYELMVRTRLCITQPTAAKLHKARVQYVNAAFQSQVLAKMMDSLTDAERDVVRRGKNAHVTNIPKAVTKEIYAEATALEALWGHLYLTGQTRRLSELFEVIWT